MSETEKVYWLLSFYMLISWTAAFIMFVSITHRINALEKKLLEKLEEKKDE